MEEIESFRYPGKQKTILPEQKTKGGHKNIPEERYFTLPVGPAELLFIQKVMKALKYRHYMQRALKYLKNV